MDAPWSDFIAVTKDNPPWQWVERAAALVGHPGRALDLGCGGGRDTRHLLSLGWHVTAVDGEQAAIEALKTLPQENLRIIQSSFEDFVFEPEEYDLVSAQFSLPFVHRDKFGDVFSRLKASLKPGGIFTGEFFGPRDEWNTPDSTMTFLTQEQVEEALRGLEVIELSEQEHQGQTALGASKYWHAFMVTARKADLS